MLRAGQLNAYLKALQSARLFIFSLRNCMNEIPVWIHRKSVKDDDSTSGFRIVEEKVRPERWVWGVIYEPTQEQIKAAEEATEKRNAEIKEEMRKETKEMRRRSVPQVEITALVKSYEAEMSVPIEPECDELHQYDDQGFYHQVGEIEQARVREFCVYRLGEITAGNMFIMRFDPSCMRLVYLYKQFHFQGWADLQKTARIPVFGYNKGDHIHRIAILPDDRFIMTDRDVFNFDLYGIEEPES